MTDKSPSLSTARNRSPPGRNDLAGGQAARHHDPASVLEGCARLPRRRQLPGLHGRGRGRADPGGILHPQARGGHEGIDRRTGARQRARHGDGAPGRRPAEARTTPMTAMRPVLGLGEGHGGRGVAFPPGRQPRARSVASGHGGQSRCLHPLQSVRPGVPRGAGQRRDRHGVARRPRRRSSSTSTTRWAPRPAWPAASACRPARPAR